MLWSEVSSVCHGRIVPGRPIATFLPMVLGSWAHCALTVPASAHTILQAVQCSPPHLGGEIDYNPLRWCILTGTGCRAYAERYRVDSRDAKLLLTRSPYRRPLSCYTSVCLQIGFVSLFSGKTVWTIVYYTLCTAAIN